jgi:hypothetical protein
MFDTTGKTNTDVTWCLSAKIYEVIGLPQSALNTCKNSCLCPCFVGNIFSIDEIMVYSAGWATVLMDNPYSPEDRLVSTSRVGNITVDQNGIVSFPLHEAVTLNLSEMPNLRVEEEYITSYVKTPSTQVTIEIRCTGYSQNSARILGRIQSIPLSDIVGQELDCWIALHGGEVDSVYLTPGQPVPQVSISIFSEGTRVVGRARHAAACPAQNWPK